jgi:rod shape determining protein RodA
MSTAISPPPSREGRSGGAARTGRRALSLPFDPVLALAVLGVCGCSLANLHYVREPGVPTDFYLTRQAIYFVLGALLAAGLSRMDYSRLREVKWGLYGVTMLALVAVMGLGSVAGGARRAIQLPFFSFQASELGKILLVVVLSAFLVDRSRRLGDRDTTARTMLLALVPAALVMAQPDLGSALVYVAIAVTVLFVAAIPARRFIELGLLGAVAVALVLVVAPATGHTVLHKYQTERLTAFLHPGNNRQDAGFQQYQARVATGSGGKTGRGDRATQARDQYLPEQQTDFAFATLAERWGFAGAGLLLSFYALMIWRALRTLTVAKNLFGALVAGGILAMLLFQVFVNVGMNVGIMPITGIPLPLVSYGGSSVITTFLAIGLLQSIYAQGRAATAGKGRVLGFT